jgi:hypothetical protein
MPQRGPQQVANGERQQSGMLSACLEARCQTLKCRRRLGAANTDQDCIQPLRRQLGGSDRRHRSRPNELLPRQSEHPPGGSGGVTADGTRRIRPGTTRVTNADWCYRGRSNRRQGSARCCRLLRCTRANARGGTALTRGPACRHSLLEARRRLGPIRVSRGRNRGRAVIEPELRQLES